MIVLMMDSITERRHCWDLSGKFPNINAGQILSIFATSFELNFLRECFPEYCRDKQTEWHDESAKMLFGEIQEYWAGKES